MDNQEEYSVPSRAEFIKLARESCTKNLSSVNCNSKNQPSLRYKEPNKNNELSLWKQELPTISIKLFLIRTICAVMLFLTVLFIDKMDIKWKSLSSEFIQECISSNQGIENAEEVVASFFEKYVDTEK